MSKIITYLIVFWIGLITLQAQSQFEWLRKQPDAKLIVDKHIKDATEASKSGFSNVSVILFEPRVDTLIVYLGAYTYLSEVKEHLPASYTIVEGQAFLIYDGSELLIENKQIWFETVKKFIDKRLCDDLDYKELLKQPGPKEVRVPCNIIYEPPIKKIMFYGSAIIKEKLVEAIPYFR